jgi:hypothetical protein
MVTAQPITKLYLTGYTLYTRASYFAQFGKPAPPADPSRPAKAWVGSGTFNFLQGMALVKQVVPPSENLPNLDGSGPFPPYVIAPSGAYTVLNNERTGQYNALYLSLQADAQALMSQLGGSGLVDVSVGVLDYDPGEQRREWEFADSKGVLVNAGAMLFIRNMQGIGAPGHWDQSGNVPVWVSDKPAINPAFTPLGPPCRALLPNESIAPGTLGVPALMVDNGQADPSTPAAGGSFNAQDRQTLNTVLQIVEQIAQK